MNTPVLAPVCPGCEAPPLFAGVTPALCPNTECNVVTWDIYAPPERFKAQAKQIDLSGWER
jgi:hypothetical protein